VRAAVLVQLNRPLEIWNLEIQQLGIGQVLVQILVSGICGAQVQEIRGNKGNEKFLPHLMGHEGCGVVEEVGLGVTKVKKGDLVVMHWRSGPGIESSFPVYSRNGKNLSGGKVTTLSEKSVVSENRLTVIPSTTDIELAALLGCSMSTALAFIENESNLKFGESVLIIGCGGVGLNLILAASLRGAGIIVGLDTEESKESLVKMHGASDFLTNMGLIKNEFDLIIDTTGNLEVLNWAFKRLSGSGRLALIGQPAPGSTLKLSNALNFFNGQGQRIQASQGGSFSPHSDIHRYLKLMEMGKLRAKSLITHRLPLSEVNEAFQILNSGSAGRIMIDMNS